MWTEEKIEGIFAQIVKEVSEADFSMDSDLRQEKLLGERVNLKARDLVILLNRIEAVFAVSIPDNFICDGNFDTYDHILEILFRLLVNQI